MDLFGVLTLFGGIALFLYGMRVMGEGIEKRAGKQMRIILEKLTANPLKSILLGAAVTAIIQSSAATTVMVVGFGNSGIPAYPPTGRTAPASGCRRHGSR